MIKLAIIKNPNSFLPEVYAYYDFFIEYDCGIEPRIYDSISDVKYADVAIVFYGFYPRWRRYKFPIIGEYNSLSIGRFRKVKDLIKRIVNKQDNVVFLNKFVKNELNYNDDKVIIRGMGYKKELIKDRLEPKKYDIVYSGTIDRVGIKENIIRLAELGFKIALVGSDEYIHENVYSLGKLNLKDVYNIYSLSEYGLNYTPDIFPYNYQDSTKVIEYCACGLKVITNKYYWINEFEITSKAKFIDIDDVENVNSIKDFEYIIPDVYQYSWENIIFNSGIISLIKNIGTKPRI